MLDEVASVDQPRRPLGQQRLGPREDLLVRHPPAAANEHGDARGGADDVVIRRGVVRRIRLDDVGPEFDRLAHDRHDEVDLAIDRVGPGVGLLHDERLDHERHAVVIALLAQFHDVADARLADLGSPRQVQEIDHHAGRIEPDRCQHGVGGDSAEHVVGEHAAVDIRDIGAHDKGGPAAAALRLEQARLARRELDGIGIGGDQGGHGSGKVLDAREEGPLAEESVVDRDVQAAPGVRIEQPAEPVGRIRHGASLRRADPP